MMATLILSLAPQTRVAAAAVTAPRKNLREVGLDIAILLTGADYIKGPEIYRACLIMFNPC
jgi:hypothetical protein